MLNRKRSTRATLTKYPVFLTAVLVVAAAFARHEHIQSINKFVPQPSSETTISAISSPEKPTKPVNGLTQSIYSKPIKPTRVNNPASGYAIQSAALNKQSLQTNTVHTSPSRYIVYQGDYLYWIVTPKMKLEDFMTIKLELAKYGCQLQLNEIKYDPLYAYIERIALSVVGPSGARASINKSLDDNKPIPTSAAYMTLNRNDTKDHEVWASRIDGRFSKTFPLYQNVGEKKFPDPLRQVADNDEAAVSQFITDKKMDYLLLAGEHRYGHLGIGFRRFTQEELKKQSKHGGFVEVNPDGSLSINEEPSPWVVKTFINNESATFEEIQQLKITQLYTLAIILGYDNTTQKRSGTDYLFFYIKETN